MMGVMRWRRILFMSIVLVVGLAGAIWWYWPDGRLRVIGCDVGQGDSILITRGFSQVLIDGGPGGKVLTCLGRYLPFWDRRIELVVLTHPQADHMDGLAEVLKRYKVGLWVANGVASESEKFGQIVSELGKTETRMYVPMQGDVFGVGDMKFEVWWPRERWGGADWWNQAVKGDIIMSDYTQDGLNLSDVNVVSVVLGLTWRNFAAAFTGDISTREELAMVEAGVIRRVAVLKIAHHGSKFSSGPAFLEETRPSMAIISVGKNNRFGHPTSETLTHLDAVSAKILRTDELGDVVVVTDGERVWAEE